MEIPEITESQLQTMLTICGNPEMSVFSQCASKDTDPLALQCKLQEGEKDINRLVSLQLLKEITDNHKEQIEKTNTESGRTWRVFEITALARAMFQTYTHPGVN